MSNRNCPFILSLLIVFISHVLLLNMYSCENRNIRYQIYTYCLLVLLTQVIINMDYNEILFILRVDIYMSINILKFTLFSYNCSYVYINVMYNNTLLYVLWIHAVQKYTVYVFFKFFRRVFFLFSLSCVKALPLTGRVILHRYNYRFTCVVFTFLLLHI